MPGRYVPSVSWLEMLSFDKFVHAGIFFALVSLLGLAVKVHSQTRALFYSYFVLCIMYGGALEIMQAKVFSERSADWYDVIANSFGCVLGLLIANKLSAILFK
jgi:VanZ family protein